MMNRNESIDYDVLIVGAGPAGVLSANLLGKAGVQVLLIDKEPDIVEIPRAVGLCNEGSRILNAAGLMEAYTDKLLPMQEVQFRCTKMKPFFGVDCSEEVNGYPIIRTLYQPDLERSMRDGLKKYNNVDFWSNTECLQIEDRGNVVRCRLLSNGDQYSNVSCRYVMGCDGARSSIRKMMGVEFSGQTYAQDWLIVDVEKDPEVHVHNEAAAGKSNDRDFIYFMCDPDRPGVTLPTPDGSRRWEFVVKSNETHESITSESSLKALLAPWGNVDEMNVVRKAIYTFHSRIAKKFRVGNVFLLGDAAHLTPPFAGQGLMAGLRDSYNLSWKLASVIKGELPDEFLDTYHKERHPQAVIIVNLAKFLGFIILPQNPWLSSLRNNVFRIYNKLTNSDTNKTMKKTPNSTLGFRSLMRGFSDISSLMVGYELLQSMVYKNKPSIEEEAVLIDDCLSDKFTLISFGESCINDNDSSVLDSFNSVSGQFCLIKSSTTQGVSHSEEKQAKPLASETVASETVASETTIYDIDGYYRNLFENGDKVILVRPDKMIVVCEERKNLNRSLKRYFSSLGTMPTREYVIA